MADDHYIVDVANELKEKERKELISRVKDKVCLSNPRYLQLSFKDGFQYGFKAVWFVAFKCLWTSFIIEWCLFWLAVAGIAMGYVFIFLPSREPGEPSGNEWMAVLGGNLMGPSFLGILVSVFFNFSALRNLSLRTEDLLLKSDGGKCHCCPCCRYCKCLNITSLLLIMLLLLIPDLCLAYICVLCLPFTLYLPIIGQILWMFLVGALIFERNSLIFWISRSQIKTTYKWRKNNGSAIAGLCLATGIMCLIPGLNFFVPFIAMVATTRLILHSAVLHARTREQLTGVPYDGDLPSGLLVEEEEGGEPSASETTTVRLPDHQAVHVHNIAGPIPVGQIPQQFSYQMAPQMEQQQQQQQQPNMNVVQPVLMENNVKTPTVPPNENVVHQVSTTDNQMMMMMMQPIMSPSNNNNTGIGDDPNGNNEIIY